MSFVPKTELICSPKKDNLLSQKDSYAATNGHFIFFRPRFARGIVCSSSLTLSTDVDCSVFRGEWGYLQILNVFFFLRASRGRRGFFSPGHWYTSCGFLRAGRRLIFWEPPCQKLPAKTNPGGGTKSVYFKELSKAKQGGGPGSSFKIKGNGWKN